METASRGLQEHTRYKNCRACAAVEVWLLFPLKIEENEYKSNNILNLLNKVISKKCDSFCELLILLLTGFSREANAIGIKQLRILILITAVLW